jgi:hypothetical protein
MRASATIKKSIYYLYNKLYGGYKSVEFAPTFNFQKHAKIIINLVVNFLIINKY